MSGSGWQSSIDGILGRLKAAGWKERDAVKEELLAFAREHASDALTSYLEEAKGALKLELRWEVDEVLEALQPEPEPEPEPEEEAEEEAEADPNAPLSMADLVQVYDDPRGLALFTDKAGTRWFAMQMDPRTGQPVTFELPPQQVSELKVQLAGSPYWLIGSGGHSAP